jgi:APA family basic amino acid/polyamine antiporter
VLIYYTIANASAFTQSASDRRWPRTLNLLGAAGCLTLVSTLSWQTVLAGVAMFTIGLTGRSLVTHRRTAPPTVDDLGRTSS